jgi:hypothetical protein
VTLEKQYQKPCRYCGASCIIWDDIHKYFANPSGEKHACPSSSTNHKQQDQNQKVNAVINDLKTEISGKLSGIERQMDSIQRGMITEHSLLVEIKAKIYGILRE